VFSQMNYSVTTQHYLRSASVNALIRNTLEHNLELYSSYSRPSLLPESSWYALH
jgi:hypothetical protein